MRQAREHAKINARTRYSFSLELAAYLLAICPLLLTHSDEASVR